MGITLDQVEDLTWLEVQAYIQHWTHDPPLQVMVARYFKIPPREPKRAERVLSEAEWEREVIADFTAIGLVPS